MRLDDHMLLRLWSVADYPIYYNVIDSTTLPLWYARTEVTIPIIHSSSRARPRPLAVFRRTPRPA